MVLKKILAILFCGMLLCTSLTVSAYAEKTSTVVESEVAPAYEIASSVMSNLSISGTTAYCKSSASGIDTVSITVEIMTKIKKFAAAIVAAVSIGAIGVSAYAASESDKDFKFVFQGYGGSDFSKELEKENKNTFAVFEMNGGYLSSDAYITLSVYKTKGALGSIVSSSYKATRVDDKKHDLSYTVARDEGSVNCLGARSVRIMVQK